MLESLGEIGEPHDSTARPGYRHAIRDDSRLWSDFGKDEIYEAFMLVGSP